MGADASLPLTAVRTDLQIMSMTFHDCDSITILHHDGLILQQVVQVINKTWEFGIQRQELCCGTGRTIKLVGNPFGPYPDFITATQTHRMVMGILQELQRIGYHVVASGCLGTTIDRGTLVFKRAPSSDLLPLCIGFIGSDTIQFTHLPAELRRPIQDTVRTHWCLGIQRIDVNSDVLRLKLAGNPWRETYEVESIMANSLLQVLFTVLYRHRWFHLANVNFNGSGDCLVFYHDANLHTFVNPEFCVISCVGTDKLRLISLPDDMHASIRTVIQANWIPGHIQDEKNVHRYCEFKLSSRPWRSMGEEFVRARYLMMKVFQELWRHGWCIVAASSFNRKSCDRVAMVFQKGEPMQPLICCIAPLDNDYIYLINMPTTLVNRFESILRRRWSQGIQKKENLAVHFGHAVVLKLCGIPWAGGQRNSPIHAKSFLCSIIDEFYREGWELMRCADVTSMNSSDETSSLDSFWFIYNPTFSTAHPSAPPSEILPAYSECGSTPYPSTTPGCGVPSSQHFNEPPPSYTEATGWTEQR